jgi:hypothetical protein
MSWPVDSNANNLEQTNIKGFLDISGGDIINRTGNLSVLDGTMDVSGDVSMNSKLSVGGDVSLNGNVEIAAGKTFNTGNGASSLGGSLTVAGITTLNETVEIATNKTFIAGGDVSMNTKLSVGGDVSLNGNVEIAAGKTFNTGNGASSLGGSLTVAGITTLNETVEIATNKTFIAGGDVSMNTKLSVGGDVSFNGTRIDICGNLYAQYPDSSIPADAISGLGDVTPNFTGVVKFENKVAINSTSVPDENSAELDVSGNINFSGELLKGGVAFVSGATDLNGLSDVISGGAQFTDSLLIGSTTTGTLDTAINNTGVGKDVFDSLTSGDNNVGMGYSALNKVTSGSNNVGIGVFAGKEITTGNNNTYIGHGANAATGLTDLSNSTAIGYNAIVTASNQIMLGTATETVVAPGQVDICGNLYAKYDEVNPSIPAGAIIGGVGSNHFTSDVSMNNNLQVFEHVTINPTTVTTNVPGIQNIDEYLKFTIPTSMTELNYFCTEHPYMLKPFTIGDYSTSETDKTYYVTVDGSAADPYYFFSETVGGVAVNDASTALTLYKGNTYTFIKADTNTVHPFSVGDTHKVTSGLKLESTGTAASYTASTYTNPYPLHVNGMVNIENNLSVARTLTVSGPIRQW